MAKKKFAVIGGVAAGMSAASQAKRVNSDLEVVAFEAGDFVSYASCGIPYYLADLVKDPKNLIAVTPEQFREKRGIDVRLRHRVESIAPDEKIITVLDVDKKKKFDFRYDKLAICTGAVPIRLKVPGIDAENVFYLRNLQDGLRLMSFLKDQNPQKAVIVGAGYVGLELAESFRARGMVVTIITHSDSIMNDLEPEIAKVVEEELNRNGAVLKKNTKLVELEKSNGMARKVITSGDEIDADVVLISVGIRPNVELAESAGIKLGTTGAISVNERMETNIAHIYSAGDCAETCHRVTGKPAWIPLGDTANKMGRVAGANAGGANETFPGIVGSAVAKVFDLAVARTGLSLKEALKHGFKASSHTISEKSRAHYYPGGKPITITLVFDTATQKLLGAQMVGADGVAKRNDVLATAITAGMTLRDVENLDLCYAPPYSPVYDPILIAARQARKS